MKVAHAPDGATAPPSQRHGRAVIIDLNNFSTFPTLAIGLLTASLRNAGFEVQVLSPLARDVVAAAREHPETWKDHLARRVHLSTSPGFRTARDGLRALRSGWRSRPHPKVLEMAREALETRPDVVLLSAYLQHYASVVALAQLARGAGVPVLLGGPAFNNDDVAEAWRRIPGVSAIFGGEADRVLPRLAGALLDEGDLLAFPGVTLPDGRRAPPAPPFRPLEDAPVPDFTDFPWDKYPVRIVPVMATRGCQWDRCRFCSDVSSVSGRTFRSRDVESLMAELREQARRHQTRNFLFLDLKLNSQPSLLRAITEQIQGHVPGARWIGTVHVDMRKDNGLSRAELKAAVAAGLRRVSFGLETGSQRLLDAMDKGCNVERNSEFLHDAYEAGLSVRCTMINGYHGETAQDLEATARFLEDHAHLIDRVRYNEFSIITGTPVHQQVVQAQTGFMGLRVLRHDHRQARTHYVNAATDSFAYRRTKARVLRAVYQINRRPIRSEASEFDGLM